jgi:hypothetical protein
VRGFNTSGALPDSRFAQRWRQRGRNSFSRTLQINLSVDDGDRAVLERVVTEIVGDAKLPATDFIARINAWLRTKHSYSTSPKIPSGPGDPLVRWLASQEAGHCELFAGSVVLLARTAGFPARVVTGFKGGSWNGYSGNFTVRNSDAHAWAEIFDAASGSWMRADALGPTAATQANETKGEAAMAARLDRSWSARLDSLRVFWYRRIVSFDQRSQVETLKAVKQATQNSSLWLREVLNRGVIEIKLWLAGPWNFGRFVHLSYALIFAGGLVWWWRAQGRRWWRSLKTRGGRRDDPVRREAGYWLGRIAPTAALAAEGREIYSELQRLRYGAQQTWPAPEPVFRRARQLVRTLRRRRV